MRRVGIVGISAALWLVFAATPASAHALGGGLDLPVPLSVFVVGVGSVMVVSFAALAVAWPTPRWQSPSAGLVLGSWGRWVVTLLSVVGLALLGLVVAAGLFGETRRTNAAPTLVWVYFWLVIPLLGALVGDLWRYLNPWRTLAGDRRRSALPSATDEGAYPAALAFVAFMWLALVPNYSREPEVLAWVAISYGLYIGAAAFLSDTERAFGSFDPFTTYNYLVGAIAPIELEPRGTWRWHGWLRRLPMVPARRGLVLFVVAMIGTITYDGLSASTVWADLWGPTRFDQWFGTAALVATVGVIGAGYGLASLVASRIGRTMTTSRVAASFAHILVPIGLAFAVTHYFTDVAFEGQLLISSASDPLGLGSDYFGTALREVRLWIGGTAVWYVQLATITAGHVTAVVLAHDRALAVFPMDLAVRSQYPILSFVVALSAVGLLLLSVT